jgi:hypothetical protein
MQSQTFFQRGCDPATFELLIWKCLLTCFLYSAAAAAIIIIIIIIIII